MKKGLVLLMLCIFVVSLCGCFGGPKKFSCEGMNITLTSDFVKVNQEGYTVCYDSKDVAVFALKESFDVQEGFGDLSLIEYAHLVHDSNAAKSPTKIAEEGDYLYFVYSYLNQEENVKYKYYSTMFRGNDAFWIIQFACKESEYEEKLPKFIEWAKTVNFDK